jgi:hypothetical protein
MSTDSVPGYDPANRDELKYGCWAEHEDGSLILVEGTEGGYVVYSVFDASEKPVMEFRDRMAEGAFKREFSWKGGDDERWEWHDKSEFPWDRVIGSGARGGTKFADADDLMSAAQRVARHRKLSGRKFDYDESRVSSTGRDIRDRIQRALETLLGD